MAQLVVLGSLGVVLAVAAIVWRRRPPQGTGRYASLGSASDLFRRGNGKSLPTEGFEDWKMHFVRIAISAFPPQRRSGFGLKPQPQGIARRPRRAGTPTCP